MPKYLDLECPCGAQVDDLFVMKVPEHIVHLECGREMEQVYRLRPTIPALEKNLAVVFRDRNGKIHYPGRNDLPTPKGYERVVLHPSQMDRFCRENNVLHEDSNYNRGGRGCEGGGSDQRLPSEEKRYERFRELTRGII
jgi:hypothetical protein